MKASLGWGIRHHTEAVMAEHCTALSELTASALKGWDTHRLCGTVSQEACAKISSKRCSDRSSISWQANFRNCSYLLWKHFGLKSYKILNFLHTQLLYRLKKKKTKTTNKQQKNTHTKNRLVLSVSTAIVTNDRKQQELQQSSNSTGILEALGFSVSPSRDVNLLIPQLSQHTQV